MPHETAERLMGKPLVMALQFDTDYTCGMPLRLMGIRFEECGGNKDIEEKSASYCASCVTHG